MLCIYIYIWVVDFLQQMIRLLYIFQLIPFCSNLFPFAGHKFTVNMANITIFILRPSHTHSPYNTIDSSSRSLCIVRYRWKMPDNKFLHTRRIRNRNRNRNVSHLYIEQNQPHHPYIHIHIALMMETICQSCSSHNNNNNKNNNRERYSNNIAWRANILNGTSNQISCNTHTRTSAHVDRYIYNS